jgi:hypothetical protein
MLAEWGEKIKTLSTRQFMKIILELNFVTIPPISGM